MPSPDAQNRVRGTPVFLLKTRSTPSDAYEQLFSAPQDGLVFEPRFVPVLKHHLDPEGTARVKRLLERRGVSAEKGSPYGGLIFTSQRAVEAFAKLVEQGGGDGDWPYLQHVPIYSVGPATTRALKAVVHDPPLQIFGEHTGNGDALGKFILTHYGEWFRDRPDKPPLLFLVGEQRSDSIPRILMDGALPRDRRIQVDEVVVYKTGAMDSFQDEFTAALNETSDRQSKWVVVFSPTGCQSMMAALGLLDDDTGRAKSTMPARKTLIATIGPTTRDHLVRTFGFEPDVCAGTPSPEGVWDGIAQYLRRSGLGQLLR